MTIKELYDYIKPAIEMDNQFEDFGSQELVIKLDYPTYGGSVIEKVTRIHFGFDWDHGRLFLDTEHKLKLSNEQI